MSQPGPEPPEPKVRNSNTKPLSVFLQVCLPNDAETLAKYVLDKFEEWYKHVIFIYKPIRLRTGETFQQLVKKTSKYLRRTLTR